MKVFHLLFLITGAASVTHQGLIRNYSWRPDTINSYKYLRLFYFFPSLCTLVFLLFLLHEHISGIIKLRFYVLECMLLYCSINLWYYWENKENNTNCTHSISTILYAFYCWMWFCIDWVKRSWAAHYLWALAVLQDLFVRVFGGEEASASSVQVLKHTQRDGVSKSSEIHARFQTETRRENTFRLFGTSCFVYNHPGIFHFSTFHHAKAPEKKKFNWKKVIYNCITSHNESVEDTFSVQSVKSPHAAV